MKTRTLALAMASVAAAALIAVSFTATGQVAGANMTAAQVKPAERADDFRLVDQNSNAHLLSYYKFAPAIVIVNHVNGSAQLKAAAPALKALQASFAGTDNKLLLLNSTPGVTREAIQADMASLGLDLPVMIAVSLACLPIFFTGSRIARWEGALFIGLYAAYLAYLVLAAQQHEALTTYGWVLAVFVLPVVTLTLLVVSWREWRAIVSARQQREGRG